MGFLSECVNKCVFVSSAFSWPLSLGFFFFFNSGVLVFVLSYHMYYYVIFIVNVPQKLVCFRMTDRWRDAMIRGEMGGIWEE